MSGECERCSEHTLDCGCKYAIEIIIHPPDGKEFDICTQCHNPCIKDKSGICLWCTLQKDNADGN